MKIYNPRAQKLYNYLSRINGIAYQDEFLLANDVLAKSPFCGDIFSIYMKKSPVKKVGLGYVFKKLVLFYLKNVVWCAIHFVKKLVHYFSGQKYSFGQCQNQLTIIDIKFVIKNIIKQNEFSDIYFPKLAEILRKKGKSFLYFPKFYGNAGLWRFYRSMKIIKNSKFPVLTEYQLIKISDYLRLLFFICLYPVKIFKLIKQLENEYEDDLLRYVLLETLDTTVIKGYLRLLCGRNFSTLPVDQLKCISWFENQSIDKSFYKGLRNMPNKVTIFGAQLFIWPDTILNLHVDEREKKFGIIPDKILVNGDYYLPVSNSLGFNVGPSMRYERMFQDKVNPLGSKNILVLMPYWEQDIVYLLSLINSLAVELPILVKFHPATDGENYVAQFTHNIKVVESALYDLLRETRLVIGVSTGTLVEAASLGVPVICIDSKSVLFHSNYFTDFGKGIIWDRAETTVEIIKLIDAFNYFLTHDALKIQKASEVLKKIYFFEPTEEAIVRAFDL